MLNTGYVELIDIREFAKMPLDENIKAFVVHMTFFRSCLKLIIRIYPARKIQIASQPTKKVKILAKSSNFSNIFLEKKTLVLMKITYLN